jgi:PAS domain-containing protein
MDNRFQVYFEQSAQAFILVKDGIIVDCNLAAVTLLGYNDKFGLLGKHLPKFHPSISLTES